MSASAAPAVPERREVVHGNAYNIFIFVLTIGSLVIMALLFMPFIDDQTKQLLFLYDNLVCIPFLIDFAINLRGTRPRRDYFIKKRGWLDLLGSIPSFGLSPYTALLRLARLSRLARVTRLMRGKNQKALVKDVLENRGQYALFVTLLLAMIVIVIASILVLQFETKGDGNIKTGGDAAWWAIVTITTVGYGDFFPVTPLGRLVGVFVMFSGVGIIGALASILASVLVTSSAPAETPAEDGALSDVATMEADDALRAAGAAVGAASEAVTAMPAQTATDHAVAQELASIRSELAALRATLEQNRTPPAASAEGST
jgi:voltage-gated potassium channel